VTVQAAPTSHRRSRAVSVSLAAMGLAACGSSGSDYRAACVDQATQNRVDDASCRTSHTGFGWYYFPRGVVFPALGGRVSGGSFTQPAAGRSVSRGGLDAKGGTVSRGGFGGGSSKSVGG